MENGTWQLIMRHMYTHLVCTISKKIQRICQVIHYDDVLNWKNIMNEPRVPVRRVAGEAVEKIIITFALYAIVFLD